MFTKRKKAKSSGSSCTCSAQMIQWFDAIKKGDFATIGMMLQACFQLFDVREDDIENEIFNGFAAIHYAVYLNIQSIVALLISYELKLYTEGTQKSVPAPGISQFAKYYVNPGMNVLHLALLRKAENCIPLILEAVERYDLYDEFSIPDKFGLTAYQVACMCSGFFNIQVLWSEKLRLTQYMKCQAQWLTVPMLAACFGRPNVAEMVLQDMQEGRFVSYLDEALNTMDKEGFNFAQILQNLDETQRQKLEISDEDVVNTLKYLGKAQMLTKKQPFIFEVEVSEEEDDQAATEPRIPYCTFDEEQKQYRFFDAQDREIFRDDKDSQFVIDEEGDRKLEEWIDLDELVVQFEAKKEQESDFALTSEEAIVQPDKVE